MHCSRSIAICLFLCACSKQVGSFTTEDLNTDLKYIKTCNVTSPISMRTINEVLINKKLVIGESAAFKCFLRCLFTKYGWMDEEGGFLLHDIKVSLKEAEVEIESLEFILYICTAIESADSCERSFLFTQCFWNKMAEVCIMVNCDIATNSIKKTSDLYNLKSATTPYQLIETLRKQVLAKEDELVKAEQINQSFERMIQLVNILGQVDSFLTDRTKTMIKKIAMLADADDGKYEQEYFGHKNNLKKK
ncbi:uncharacterized protein isoform X1 [Leptinotarsa decemlineata]|uniref:uncharacterized protein isoform X1 n=1 Tax=Leptinotarsa decemlineata TaxID=7539 RepID=UPI003D308438